MLCRCLRGQARFHRYPGCTQFRRSPQNLVGAGLPAKAVCQPINTHAMPTPSRASPLPQVSWLYSVSPFTAEPCGSWLASESGVSANRYTCYADAFAGKPAPTGILAVLNFAVHRRTLWELASESAVSANKYSCYADAFAGKLASTGILAVLNFAVHRRTLWELACQRKRCVSQ